MINKKKSWKAPTTLMTSRANGMSNGTINNWAKVIDGRYDFFQEFLRAETDVLDIDAKDKPTL